MPWRRLAVAPALSLLAASALAAGRVGAYVGLTLAAQALAAMALVALARRFTRVWDRTRWIDSVMVSGSAAITALGIALAEPSAGASLIERWIVPLLPAGALFLLLLGTRSLLALRDRPMGLRALNVGLLAGWIGQVVAAWTPPGGPPGHPAVLASAAVATGLGVLAAAADPATTRAAAPVRAIPWRRMGPVRFGVLVSSVVAPLVALAALAVDGALDGWSATTLVLGVAGLVVLVLVRTSGLVTYADALADERHRSRFEALADHAHDAVAIIDTDDRVLWASPAVRTVLGPDPASLAGRSLADLLTASTARDLAPSLDQLARMPLGSTMAISARTVDGAGHERDLEGTATNLLDEPAVEGIVVVVRDVTERVAMQRQLVEQAFVDPLTGLANRALFVDRVGHALARARNGEDRSVGVLFVDLDDFKGVNDSLGHGSGDDLLAAVGRRIAESLGPGDTAARLGGDEFAVLLEATDVDEATAVASRILELLSVPLAVGELTMAVSASIGVALATDPSDTTAVLLRNADLAMYDAKRDGKGQVRTYRRELHERELRQFTYRADLAVALDRGEMQVVYQPIVDMETEEVTGAEALLRWTHPERGPVSPLDFIPVAESSRAIIPIGRWVLRTACTQLATWHRDLGPLTMDVNVSAVQLLDPGFVGDVAEILRDTGVEPGCVVLELTESILVHDADHAREVLERLRGLGVRLAIDDFGTGYSSLAYLQTFPIDIVKIDRAFVNQLGDPGRGRSLARSIIAIAGSLGIATIAEGVETETQAAHLAALECEHGQGFHWSRPVPPADFDALVARRVPATQG